MAAPLTEYTEEQRWFVTKFLWSDGVKTSNLWKDDIQYGGNCMSNLKVYKWVQTFKGQVSVVDNVLNRLPATVMCWC
jgi:hypothetical protein